MCILKKFHISFCSLGEEKGTTPSRFLFQIQSPPHFTIVPPTESLEQAKTNGIHRKKKHGDWYIYSEVLARITFNNAPKNVQKSSYIFNPSIHVVSTWTNIAKIWLSLYSMGRVRFTRHCGKMYSRHLFSFGGLIPFS